MKILFLESHALWIHGLPNGFADAGHTAIVSGRLTKENIAHMLETFSPDLVVSMGWTPEHTPTKQRWIRDAVKEKQIPLVYWATEDPLHTESFTIPLLKRMQPDFVFTVTQSLCKLYERMGVKADHLDFAYHSSVHNRIEPLDAYSCDIAVVANAYPDYLLKEPDAFRMKSLETLVFPLLQNDMRIDFWGKDWDSMKYFTKTDIPKNWIHGYLDYSVANKVYSSAKIVIGPQNCIDQLTMRTYEILGSGGFLLTSDTPAVREKFQPKHHLIVSSSPKETLAKVKYYLSHHREREQVRINAQQDITKESYQQRAERMVEVLADRGVIRKAIYSGPGKVINYPRYIRQNYVVHTTQIGDTLVRIAETYGVSPNQIMKLNKLTSDFIYAGEMLKIKTK